MGKQYNILDIQAILSKIFKGIDLNSQCDKGYVKVTCPFHHDLKESGGVNPNDGYFRCFACPPAEGQKHDDSQLSLQFDELIKKYFKFTKDKDVERFLSSATTGLNTIETNEVETKNKETLSNLLQVMELNKIGISTQTIKECKIHSTKTHSIVTPVLMDGVNLGYTYIATGDKTTRAKPYCTPSLKTGYIVPFDLWQMTQGPTLICEGQKDMLIARSQGFNAITLTGGCQANLPAGWEAYFFDREVAICFDNDKGGKTGAIKLANKLYQAGCRKIRIITNYYNVIKVEGEDIGDFFMKYKCTADDLRIYIRNTPYWTQTEVKKSIASWCKPIPLYEAVRTENINQKRQSTIQVRAEAQAVKSIPKYINIIHKLPIEGNEGTSYKRDVVQVPLDEKNMEHIPFLLDTKSNIGTYCKSTLSFEAMNLNKNSHYIGAKYVGFELGKERQAVYINLIGGYNNTEILGNDMGDADNQNAKELLAYSFDPMVTSKIYDIQYTPIPNKNQETVLVVSKVEQTDSALSFFKVSNETKAALETFKATNINLKVRHLYDDIKYNRRIKSLDFDLWLAYELTFNSCLKFYLNNDIQRGTIYTNVIGDTRTGKSKLAETLMGIYKQGKKVNTKLATTLSLVGGTDEVGKERFIKAGVLPRNNRGLVVLEELHGLGNDYFKKITEVKSSGKVSITRVSGELELECFVRLIEIANPVLRNQDDEAKHIAQYPNGIRVIRDLILSPEDIARNDIYIIIAHKQIVSPYGDNPLINKISDEHYQERLKWAWSRKPENIKFENEAYIWTQVNTKLNPKFDCASLTILGPEGHIKIAKMAVALAIMLGSTTTYEDVYVKNEHVDYIVNWLHGLYSNDIMKIDEYVNEEKLFSTWNNLTDIKVLEELYKDWQPAIDYLEKVTDTTQDNLNLICNKTYRDTPPLYNKLVTNYLVKINNKKVVPTAKFRHLVKKINKAVSINNDDLILKGGM